SSTSAAVKSVTAVELATAVEATIAMKSAITAKSLVAMESTIASEPTIATKNTTASESTPSPKIVAKKEPPAAETMEPRPRADENAASKIIWAIESIGCASVGVIPVVTVGANRRWHIIARAYSNAHRHLRVSPTRCKN